MVKQPPFGSDRTYFNRDAKLWIAQNRTWTLAQTNTTLDTLWSGDMAIRALYRTHRTGPNAGALAAYVPGRVAIPLHPYIDADALIARQNKQMPPLRNAAGGLLVAVPVAPVIPTAPAATAASAPGTDQGTQTGAEPAAPAVVPAAMTNPYQFDFWPPQPWDQDPDTSTLPLFSKLQENEVTAVNGYMDGKPLMWKANETNWRGGRFLASGAYGAAGLWCRVDERNNVVERMVVKDCEMRQEQYSNPNHWRDQVPKEIALHRRIDRKRKREDTSDSGLENLVEHHGYRLMMRKRRYRLYLKYYAGGDLGRPVKDIYPQWSRENRSDGLLMRLAPGELLQIQTLPEGLIWYILQSLVKALLILHHGTTSHTETDPDWKPITHLDININNAFIQVDTASKKLPQVILADFGMGFFERDAPPTVEGEEPPPSENPFEYVWNHNHKSHAIEHQTLTGNPPYPLGEKTDVWKLGALIWELMTCSRDNNEPMREDVLNHEHEDEYGQPMIEKISVTSVDHQADLTPEAMFPEPWRLYPSAHGYSGDLKVVVRNCLHWKPQSRTSLTQLDSDIDGFVAGNPMVMHNATTPLEKENDPFRIGRRLMRFRKY